MGPVESKIRRTGCAVTAAALLLCHEVSRADQGGTSFWLPGTYGSLVAVPLTPGWSLSVVYYYNNVAASGNVAASKETQASSTAMHARSNSSAAQRKRSCRIPRDIHEHVRLHWC